MSKVLVIDDDPMILRMAGFILKKGGHEAVTAASGAHGLEKARSGGLELVFIDNEMPDMSGLDVLSAIRADSSLSELRVYIMTGTLTDELREKAASLGAAGCIGKPLIAAEMLGIIG